MSEWLVASGLSPVSWCYHHHLSNPRQRLVQDTKKAHENPINDPETRRGSEHISRYLYNLYQEELNKLIINMQRYKPVIMHDRGVAFSQNNMQTIVSVMPFQLVCIKCQEIFVLAPWSVMIKIPLIFISK